MQHAEYQLGDVTLMAGLDGIAVREEATGALRKMMPASAFQGPIQYMASVGCYLVGMLLAQGWQYDVAEEEAQGFVEESLLSLEDMQMAVQLYGGAVGVEEPGSPDLGAELN